MKKVFILMMLIFSTFAFGNNISKSYGESITEKVKFGMTKEELQNAIQKTPLPKSKEDGRYSIFYYSEVEDPIGISRTAATFTLTDNKVTSSVFSTKTTEDEHRQIIKAYSENRDKLSNKKMKKIEKQKSLFLYNSKKMIEVYRIMGYTYIIIQPATSRNIKAKSGLFRFFK